MRKGSRTLKVALTAQGQTLRNSFYRCHVKGKIEHQGPLGNQS